MGYRRHLTTLLRDLHNRGDGEGGIATEDAHHALVGTPRVSIALAEANALAGQLIQTRRNLWMSTNLRKLSATTLHHYQYDVRALRGEQRGGSLAVGIVDAISQLATFFVRHIVVADNIVARLTNRREEREDGVHRCMVQELVLREIHLSDVGCRLAQTTSNAYNDRTYQQ